jgi:hypothetical protein
MAGQVINDSQENPNPEVSRNNVLAALAAERARLGPFGTRSFASLARSPLPAGDPASKSGTKVDFDTETSGVPSNLAAVDEEFSLLPEFTHFGNGTRVGQTVYEGAAFKAVRRGQFNRVVVRFTLVTPPGALRLLLFQRPGGIGGGPTNLIATCDVAPGALGNFEITPAQGLVSLDQGVVYALWGRSSALGTFTFRTLFPNACDLITFNVQAGTHPTPFATVIPVSTVPTTFNPLTQALTTFNSTAPAMRFKRV